MLGSLLCVALAYSWVASAAGEQGGGISEIERGRGVNGPEALRMRSSRPRSTLAWVVFECGWW